MREEENTVANTKCVTCLESARAMLDAGREGRQDPAANRRALDPYLVPTALEDDEASHCWAPPQ